MSITGYGYVEFTDGAALGEWDDVLNLIGFAGDHRTLYYAMFGLGGIAVSIVEDFRGAPPGLARVIRSQWSDEITTDPDTLTWALWSELRVFEGKSEVDWNFYPCLEDKEKGKSRRLQKHIIKIGEDWQLVFEVMRRLGHIYGQDNVRLTMWFD